MRPRSILLVVAALVVAGGLFLVLRPDDDDGESAAPAMTSQPTTTTAAGGTTTVAPPAPPAPQGPARIAITVEGGVPEGGPRRVTVAKGRRVVLVVTSDVADHVHLHGYDVMRDVGPGSPARIAFTASIVGTVEAELEDSGVQIATITTKP